MPTIRPGTVEDGLATLEAAGAGMGAPELHPEAAEAAEPAGPSHLRLGEILIRRALIDQDDLALALAQQDLEGRDAPLGRLLVNLGAISDVTLTAALAEQSGLAVVDLDDVRPDQALFGRLTYDVALRLRALPIESRDGTVVVAVAEPPTRDFRREIVRLLEARVDFVLALPEALQRATALAFAAPSASQSFFVDAPLDLVPATGARYVPASPDPSTDHQVPEADVVAPDAPDATLQWLLTFAADARARSLHLLTEPAGVSVRARVDGDMQDVMELPTPGGALLVGRVLRARSRSHSTRPSCKWRPCRPRNRTSARCLP